MIYEIIITCVIGTMLHFTYELSHHDKIVALFSAVNESTWEHIKIGLTASFLTSIIDGMFLGSNPNYFVGKAVSFLLIICLIFLLFYLYTWFTKKAILPIDIIIFYVTIALSNIAFYKIIELEQFTFTLQYISVIVILAIFGFYMVATLLPLKNFIFKDPITHKYGIKGHSEIHEHKH